MPRFPPVVAEGGEFARTGELPSRGLAFTSRDFAFAFAKLNAKSRLLVPIQESDRALASELAAMTEPERLKRWRGKFNFWMRCESEAGADHYGVFDADICQYATRVDPSFSIDALVRTMGLNPLVVELCRSKCGSAEWRAVRARIPED
jgi:hypothetical protein